MTTVFGHGRLRLYLLKLLDDGPRHGYELIRLLEERFLGLYAPSAGTIYPRLARLEAEGLVTHDAVGGRKVYRITEAGRAELRQRADEVASLESEIRASVSDLAKLAGEIRSEVRGSVRDLKQELRAAARESRRGSPPGPAYPGAGFSGPAAGSGSGGPGWSAGPRAGERVEQGWSAAQGDDPAAEFDRQLLLFVTEVRALARSGRFTEPQLRTAARLLHGALDGLRRLLR
ncbi:PadR family transcriptional regulator [Plantactinospora sp. BB1]|uniref:PadR family transcriptional regulator n=1 Tax=Plantactinospora sp. BB1 TaxID=2071627 RepID=UPI000D151D78|nr:PadR family transcriptional regulator [Plantactinospora sp. BB1]AVT36887.1 PadR family transcriptional regulator [Plantactinospora sp. BB1]